MDNRHNLDTNREFLSDELHESGISHLRQFFDAFTDNRTTLLDMFGEGDKIVARLLVRGTNLGSFAGQPPTGRKVDFHSIRIYRFENQKIVETWAMQDRLGLMEQLGFVRLAGEVDWASGEEEEQTG